MKIRLVKCKLVSWSSADMLLRFREAVPHKKKQIFFLKGLKLLFTPLFFPLNLKSIRFSRGRLNYMGVTKVSYHQALTGSGFSGSGRVG